MKIYLLIIIFFTFNIPTAKAGWLDDARKARQQLGEETRKVGEQLVESTNETVKRLSDDLQREFNNLESLARQEVTNLWEEIEDLQVEIPILLGSIGWITIELGKLASNKTKREKTLEKATIHRDDLAQKVASIRESNQINDNLQVQINNLDRLLNEANGVISNIENKVGNLQNAEHYINDIKTHIINARTDLVDAVVEQVELNAEALSRYDAEFREYYRSQEQAWKDWYDAKDQAFKDYYAEKDQTWKNWYEEKDQSFKDYYAERNDTWRNYYESKDQAFKDYYASKDQAWRDWYETKSVTTRDWLAERNDAFLNALAAASGDFQDWFVGQSQAFMDLVVVNQDLLSWDLKNIKTFASYGLEDIQIILDYRSQVGFSSLEDLEDLYKHYAGLTEFYGAEAGKIISQEFKSCIYEDGCWRESIWNKIWRDIWAIFLETKCSEVSAEEVEGQQWSDAKRIRCYESKKEELTQSLNQNFLNFLSILRSNLELTIDQISLLTFSLLSENHPLGWVYYEPSYICNETSYDLRVIIFYKHWDEDLSGSYYTDGWNDFKYYNIVRDRCMAVGRGGTMSDFSADDWFIVATSDRRKFLDPLKSELTNSKMMCVNDVRQSGWEENIPLSYNTCPDGKFEAKAIHAYTFAGDFTLQDDYFTGSKLFDDTPPETSELTKEEKEAQEYAQKLQAKANYDAEKERKEACEQVLSSINPDYDMVDLAELESKLLNCSVYEKEIIDTIKGIQETLKKGIEDNLALIKDSVLDTTISFESYDSSLFDGLYATKKPQDSSDAFYSELSKSYVDLIKTQTGSQVFVGHRSWGKSFEALGNELINDLKGTTLKLNYIAAVKKFFNYLNGIYEDGFLKDPLIPDDLKQAILAIEKLGVPVWENKAQVLKDAINLTVKNSVDDELTKDILEVVDYGLASILDAIEAHNNGDLALTNPLNPYGTFTQEVAYFLESFKTYVIEMPGRVSDNTEKMAEIVAQAVAENPVACFAATSIPTPGDAYAISIDLYQLSKGIDVCSGEQLDTFDYIIIGTSISITVAASVAAALNAAPIWGSIAFITWISRSQLVNLTRKWSADGVQALKVTYAWVVENVRKVFDSAGNAGITTKQGIDTLVDTSQDLKKYGFADDIPTLLDLTQGWKKTEKYHSVSHVIKGDIKSSGLIGGGLHTNLGLNNFLKSNPEYVSQIVTKESFGNGVKVVKIPKEAFNSAGKNAPSEGEFILKSMYPDTWSVRKVIEASNEVATTGIKISDNVWQKVVDGVKIEVVKRDGEIITSYPSNLQ